MIVIRGFSIPSFPWTDSVADVVNVVVVFCT